MYAQLSLFENKMNNKFYGIFGNALIFWGKIINFENLYFFLPIYRYSEIIGNTHLFPLHNEPSPMLVG